MKKLNYIPIDYRTWELGKNAREGVNIKRLKVLTPKEQELWNQFTTKGELIRQDLRNDPGQAEYVTYFAIKLLPYSPGSLREISIPAAIVHDTGWELKSPTAWSDLMYGMTAEEQEAQKEELRRAHQEKGGDNLIEACKAINYPAQKYRDEAEAIIRDHDTRYNPATPSGRVMMDADILWRFTMTNILCSKYPRTSDEIKRNGLWPQTPKYINHQTGNPIKQLLDSPESILDYMQNEELGKTDKQGKLCRFFLPESYQIARIELANTMYDLFPDRTDLLRKDFSKELEQVAEFYSK
ncbi:hypothetical protein CMI42_01895 [Candidatus Pacearchaeota archaeon]|nr:hypothetical protein [Candidatus Pacearchaeota archaeon]|tara:strand:- start:1020 stop:1907 length:888 start_codon:yes stop_codon:yes gene_type:complete